MEAPAFECVVSADMFRRALASVSTDDFRTYLSGVRVEPCPGGGALLVATDGRRLLALRDEKAFVRGTGTVRLSKSLIRALTAAKLIDDGVPKKVRKTRLVAVRADKAAVVEVLSGQGIDHEGVLGLVDAPNEMVGAYQWRGALIQGDYPDWRRVIGEPDEAGKAPDSLDVRLLAPLADALRPPHSGAKGQAACRILPNKDAGGPVFVFPAQPDKGTGFAILMPLHGHEEQPAFSVPAWVRPAAQQMAAE